MSIKDEYYVNTDIFVSICLVVSFFLFLFLESTVNKY